MKKLLYIAVCLQIALLSLNANAFGKNAVFFELETTNLFSLTDSKELLPGKTEKFGRMMSPGKWEYQVEILEEETGFEITIGTKDETLGKTKGRCIDAEDEEYGEYKICRARLWFEVEEDEYAYFTVKNISNQTLTYDTYIFSRTK